MDYQALLALHQLRGHLRGMIYEAEADVVLNESLRASTNSIVASRAYNMNLERFRRRRDALYELEDLVDAIIEGEENA